MRVTRDAAGQSETELKREIYQALKLTIPLVPPSVNHYVKHTRTGRHYVTKEAKAFKAAVAIIAAGKALVAKRYGVVCQVYLGKGVRGDADNFGKCLLDSLVAARVIHSDSAVTSFTVEKFRDWENQRTEITVRSLDDVLNSLREI